MIAVGLTGFFTAFSLILAIGAQNAFVLRQGLLRRHVFALCLLCALSDAILISAGVAGFGFLVTAYPVVPKLMASAGAVFLITYGALRVGAVFLNTYDLHLPGGGRSLRQTLWVGLALTWLNPHVYLDTLALIGAVSTQYQTWDEKIVFAVAAMSASFIFFFALGYGARLLSPVMHSKRSWQILDLLIAGIMWSIAARLIFGII